MRASIDDTYAEGFDGLFTRVLLTAKDDRRLKKAAYNSTALPSVVIGRTEGGVERWLSEEETPDHRKGAMLQFWGMFNEADPAKSVARFDRELSYRIRQGILVVPTTALYNAHESTEQIDTMNRVGHCGDGYEWEEDLHGRRVIRIPLMMGDFVIERYLGYGRGVMGGNIWFMCPGDRAHHEPSLLPHAAREDPRLDASGWGELHSRDRDQRDHDGHGESRDARRHRERQRHGWRAPDHGRELRGEAR
jgi:formylmethanofuran--tetrahydromethanopterin N-formyltransferase